MKFVLGVPGVPAVSHPHPGHLFEGLSRSLWCMRGVSRLSWVNYDPSHMRTRARTRAHAPVGVSQISRDSRDTPSYRTVDTLSPSNCRPTPSRDTPGHPGTPSLEVFE